MIDLPPLSAIRRLPIITLVKLCRMAITAAVQTNCLEHVMADLIEEMDMEDVLRIKHQLDRSEGILKRIIERRVQWNDWPPRIPTAPVAMMDIGQQDTQTLQRVAANIERELNGRREGEFN